MTGRQTNVWDLAQLRWQHTDPWLRFLVQAAAAAVFALAGFAALSAFTRISETAASVLVAVVFGSVSFLQVRQTQRRQHTVNLLTQFQSTDSLSAADAWMAERIASHRPVPATLASDERGHVVTILDYYEFLSTLAVRGIIDMRLLLRLRGGSMTRCLATCRDYIDHRRADVGDELYRCLEMLASEHARHMAGERRTPVRHLLASRLRRRRRSVNPARDDS